MLGPAAMLLVTVSQVLCQAAARQAQLLEELCVPGPRCLLPRACRSRRPQQRPGEQHPGGDSSPTGNSAAAASVQCGLLQSTVFRLEWHVIWSQTTRGSLLHQCNCLNQPNL